MTTDERLAVIEATQRRMLAQQERHTALLEALYAMLAHRLPGEATERSAAPVRGKRLMRRLEARG